MSGVDQVDRIVALIDEGLLEHPGQRSDEEPHFHWLPSAMEAQTFPVGYQHRCQCGQTMRLTDRRVRWCLARWHVRWPGRIPRRCFSARWESVPR